MSALRAAGRRIAGQKRAVDALLESEQKLRAILQTAVDAVITIDERGLIESANPATQKLFGYSESELLGRNVSILMPQPYQSEHDGYIRNHIRTGHAKIIGIGREVLGLRKDNTTFPLNLSVSEVRLKGRRIFTGIVHDLSERRRLEKQILDASTNEQRRIGQDLHDGLCQELIGLGFSVELLANQLKGSAPKEEKLARKLGESIRQAAGHARQIAHGLNPVDVKAGGLPGALKHLASRVSETFGIACTFRRDTAADISDDAVATHFYRIAQEAVNNSVKHGRATKVDIGLVRDQGNVSLVVQDNGVGLPLPVARTMGRGAAVTGAPSKEVTGMGLQTMHYRARLIGGVLEIGSSPRGTIVNCSIRSDLPVGNRKRNR